MIIFDRRHRHHEGAVVIPARGKQRRDRGKFRGAQEIREVVGGCPADHHRARRIALDREIPLRLHRIEGTAALRRIDREQAALDLPPERNQNSEGPLFGFPLAPQDDGHHTRTAWPGDRNPGLGGRGILGGKSGDQAEEHGQRE